MRKLLIVLFGIIFISGVAVGVYLYLPKEEQTSIEEVLPEGALIYAKTSNVQNNLKQLASNPLWQNIMNIDYARLESNDIINAKQRDFMGWIQGNFSDVEQNPLFTKLFGQEVALVIYPTQFNFEQLNKLNKVLDLTVLQNLFSDMAVVARVSPEIKLAEITARFWGKSQSEVDIKTVDYQGHTIHVMTMLDGELAVGFTRIEDLLIMGMGETAARNVWDVLDKKDLSLGKGKVFQKAQKKVLENSDLMGFVDISEIVSMIKGQMIQFMHFMRKTMKADEQDLSGMQEKLEEGFKKVSGLNMVGFSIQWGELSRQRYDLFLDEEKLDDEVALMYACSGDKNNTIGFVPQDIVAYQWGNCLNLDYYWTRLQEEMGKVKNEEGAMSPFDQVKGVEQMLGVSIEKDIIPALGDEIGGYLSDVRFLAVPVAGEIPVPELVFFIEVINQESIQQLLSKLLTNPFVALQEEKYKDVRLYYMELPLGEMVTPGYCFLGDYLLMATNRDLLKKSIEAYQEGSKSIMSAIDFKPLTLGETEAARNVQFVRVGQLTRKVKEIVGWSTQRVSQRDKNRLAFKSGGQRRLEDIQLRIEEHTKRIEEIKAQLVVLEDEIWEGESQGQDVTDKKKEMEQFKDQRVKREMELEAEYERKEEQEAIVSSYGDRIQGVEKRQLYLEEIINPILDGLETIQAFGAKTTTETGVLESQLFLKW